MRPYLWRSAIAVAPIFQSRGVQNKVLEAAAAGLPSVVTRTVGTGLPSQVLPACRIADTADAVRRRRHRAALALAGRAPPRGGARLARGACLADAARAAGLADRRRVSEKWREGFSRAPRIDARLTPSRLTLAQQPCDATARLADSRLRREGGARKSSSGRRLRHRDVAGATPLDARGGSRARVDDEPGAGRRAEDRDVGLAVAVVVAGHGDVAAVPPLDARARTSCSS